jgi:hypothetical protein
VGGEVAADLLGRNPLERVALGLVDLGEHPVDAAVDVVDRDHPVARVDEVHQRHRRGDARAVGDPVLCAFERCEAGLERRAGRVSRARVVVALVLADRVLNVRRRLVDRRR